MTPRHLEQDPFYWKCDFPLWERAVSEWSCAGALAEPLWASPEPCCPQPRQGLAPGCAFLEMHISRGYKYSRSQECRWKGWRGRELLHCNIHIYLQVYLSIRVVFFPCWPPRSCCSAQAAAEGQDPRWDPGQAAGGTHKLMARLGEGIIMGKLSLNETD